MIEIPAPPATVHLGPLGHGPARDARFVDSCHRWLETARHTTVRPDIQRLIDDLHDDLYASGPIDAEMEELVRGALASVASAIDVEGDLLASLTLSSLN